jgi:hypothetical protein
MALPIPQAKTAHISRVMGTTHRELFVGQQGPTIAMDRTCLHEAITSITVLHPLSILGKCRRVPHRGLRRRSDKPTDSRLWSSGTISCHSRHTPLNTCSHRALRNGSGGIDGRPVVAYSVRKSLSRSRNTSRTNSRYGPERSPVPGPVAPARYTTIPALDRQMFRA